MVVEPSESPVTAEKGIFQHKLVLVCVEVEQICWHNGVEHKIVIESVGRMNVVRVYSVPEVGGVDALTAGPALI